MSDADYPGPNDDEKSKKDCYQQKYDAPTYDDDGPRDLYTYEQASEWLEKEISAAEAALAGLPYRQDGHALED